MSKPWLLTGLPRSGTTLLSALTDSMEESVCLSEPLWQVELARTAPNAEAFAVALTRDMQRLRTMLLTGQPVMDHRRADGRPVTNYLNENGEHMVPVVPLVRGGLGADFLLAAKHNGLFLGALPQLVASGQFRIIALIRSPLEVLASWRMSPLPVSRGELPAASYFWPQLAALQRAPMELLERQIRLLDMLYQRLYEQEKNLTLLRYESLVAQPMLLEDVVGRRLGKYDFSVIKQKAKPMDVPLETVLKKLKDIAPHARYYYPDF
ncbi:MAG: sulfotransferase [Alphaproteobacteria bacterium]|nr:sulfotransferase [Alphaproteobacteria bacterium]